MIPVMAARNFKKYSFWDVFLKKETNMAPVIAAINETNYCFWFVFFQKEPGLVRITWMSWRRG